MRAECRSRFSAESAAAATALRTGAQCHEELVLAAAAEDHAIELATAAAAASEEHAAELDMLRDELSSELQQALADAEDAKDDAISAAESAARDVADSEIAWVRAEVGPGSYCSPCHRMASQSRIKS